MTRAPTTTADPAALEERLLGLLTEREAELDRLEEEIRAYRAAHRPKESGDAGTSRDAAIAELLRRTGGLEQRLDHLRIVVENMDAKLEALADATLDGLASIREREGSAAVMGRDAFTWRRLLTLAALVLAALLWWSLSSL